MERAKGRDQGIPEGIRSPAMEPARPPRHRRAVTAPDAGAAVDIERFPVMVRLGQIQEELRSLGNRLERIDDTIDRLERATSNRLAPLRTPPLGGIESIPPGITARANPMTHPITPPSVNGAADGGRDEALATVRALFTRRRPWWQRLPDLLRG